jgi:hypothetical protein
VVIEATMHTPTEKIGRLLPGFMTMGQTGMGGHGEHAMYMPLPRNSIPMRGGHGPHGYIDMGGMFTVLKVREGLTSYDDPGWYDAPEGTTARPASAEELEADGIEAETAPAMPERGGHHHREM